MQNGMTPLHLATWTAMRTHDTSVVEALLDHNAEVAALDKVRASHFLSNLDKCRGVRMSEWRGQNVRMGGPFGNVHSMKGVKDYVFWGWGTSLMRVS